MPSNAEILAVWERARVQGPAARALTLLGAVSPLETLEQLHAVSIGERDARLLQLREQLFGAEMPSVATCPECQTRLEFTLNARALSHESVPASVQRVSVGEMELVLRPVNAGDLVAASSCPTHAEARRVLCERCVVEARRGDTAISFAAIDRQAIEEVSAALAAADPGAELVIDVGCASCAHRWQVVFDVVAFLWTEIDALARRLLSEVHALAWAYGWREADILGLSEARRRFYLERVS